MFVSIGLLSQAASKRINSPLFYLFIFNRLLKREERTWITKTFPFIIPVIIAIKFECRRYGTHRCERYSLRRSLVQSKGNFNVILDNAFETGYLNNAYTFILIVQLLKGSPCRPWTFWFWNWNWNCFLCMCECV